MTNEFNLDGKFRSYSIGLMPYIQAAGLFVSAKYSYASHKLTCISSI